MVNLAADYIKIVLVTALLTGMVQVVCVKALINILVQVEHMLLAGVVLLVAENILNAHVHGLMDGTVQVVVVYAKQHIHAPESMKLALEKIAKHATENIQVVSVKMVIHGILLVVCAIRMEVLIYHVLVKIY